jgi:hypothetical protein
VPHHPDGARTGKDQRVRRHDHRARLRGDGPLPARIGQLIPAGATAGLVLAVLGMGTFAVIDNAFLSIVSRQQAKVAGFRASGMSSMRAYVNADLESTAPGVAILLRCVGMLGALIDRERCIARARRRPRDLTPSTRAGNMREAPRAVLC